MKINNLTNGLVATLLMVSPIAGAETDYPAADFKPKVIYQDAEYGSQGKSTATVVPAKQEKSVEADSNYPAANFEPKVLYKDTEYKPSKLPDTVSTSRNISGVTVADDAVAVSKAEKAPEESMLSYLLGLAVFAVAGFVFLGQRAPKAKVSDAPVYSAHVSGLSGVARYMRKHNMAAVTGVARYLESQVVPEKEATAAAVSGVEKYLEKKAVSEKEKAAEARTGVEKYMRNRG
ncbi:MAG: hypothetical protein ACNA7G_11840 [Methylobacter sp.]